MSEPRQPVEKRAAAERGGNTRDYLIVHFWFTEQVPESFKRLALFAFAWFIAVFFITKSLGLFEETSGFTAGGKWALVLATGIPLLLVAYVVLRFYWWLSAYISRVAGWGSEFGWIRWFWFFVLAISTYLYLDPLDNIGRLIARVELVTYLGKYGFPAFNPMLLTFRLLLILFLVMALWNYLRQGLLVAGCWLKETWQFCVSLLQGLAVTLTCFFRPNVCVEYPEHRSEIPSYFRGRHYLAIGENGRHLCGTCRACENICPDRLILISTVRNPETKKLELTGFLLDNSRCCFCGLCEDVCPLSALKHSSEYEYSCYERRDLVLDLFSEYLERSQELRVKHGGANVG